MPTTKQELGERGEILVTKACKCPRCKRPRTFRRLRANFKCADIICDFCGFTAQVKATSQYTEGVPGVVMGAAWKVQKERMDAGIYLPLFLVQIAGGKRRISYLSADLQEPEMFQERAPLSATARRAGWQGFLYRFSDEHKRRFVAVYESVLK